MTLEIRASGEVHRIGGLAGGQHGDIGAGAGRKTDAGGWPIRGDEGAVGGCYLTEPRDLNEAIQIAAKIPPAEVGCIEVRPVRPIRELAAAATAA